ncbi:MAG: (2Fe-2S)-binding protein [Ideonella sp.]|nr:(2Fe-2S)-binding protein [Ideonella sp.]MCC7458543.1 (2Fe-2S)-binding protein [Nitrospira sp.]
MIVCLCHRVSDRDIVRAVASGVCCFEVLQDDTRVASSCGCCHDCAREVFDEAMAGAPCACAAQPARAGQHAAQHAALATAA